MALPSTVVNSPPAYSLLPSGVAASESTSPLKVCANVVSTLLPCAVSRTAMLFSASGLLAALRITLPVTGSSTCLKEPPMNIRSPTRTCARTSAQFCTFFATVQAVLKPGVATVGAWVTGVIPLVVLIAPDAGSAAATDSARAAPITGSALRT